MQLYYLSFNIFLADETFILIKYLLVEICFTRCDDGCVMNQNASSNVFFCYLSLYLNFRSMVLVSHFQFYLNTLIMPNFLALSQLLSFILEFIESSTLLDNKSIRSFFPCQNILMSSIKHLHPNHKLFLLDKHSRHRRVICSLCRLIFHSFLPRECYQTYQITYAIPKYYHIHNASLDHVMLL